MNRFLLLIFIAGITFLVVMFFARPDLLENIWMWLIGFAGGIVKLFDTAFTWIKNLVTGDKDRKDEADGESGSTVTEKKKKVEAKPFNGTTMKLLRYSDDGQTTVGLLYINGSFYCYTLEDTFNEEKVPGETRIPEGTYNIGFREEETEFTRTYKERYPEWFSWHLQLQNVPGFDSIYIHNGGDPTDTEGCILVSDSLSISDETTVFSNSRNTFNRLYRFLSDKLENSIPVRIVIRDEKWYKDLN
jgi:hypothetical protein